ncbi:MAG TPA: SURF1 family protein [Pedococcus sp.]
MLRVLTSRKWLGALAAAAVFATAAFLLGRWQWHRYEAKAANAQRIHTHYGAAPRPIADVLGPAPVPLAREWTRVSARGTYAASETLLVRNRPLEGNYGYEVVVPLVLPDGSAVLVDRGWVPNARNAQTLPSVPPAPSGPVAVTGWVHQGEPSLGKDLPRGQLASISLSDARRQVPQPLLGGYVVLQSEQTPSGSHPPRPTPLEKPDTDLGPHQAYAFQWWAGMLAAFVLVLLGARREYLEGDGVGQAPRPRRVRIWDEEDE